MTTQELSAKTVIELRKLAKENGVTLGAGVSKSDIVAKLAAALGDEPTAAQPVAETPAAEKETETKPAEAPAAPQTQYKAAWHSPSAAPRYNSRPAYQAPSYPQRPAWQSNQTRPGPVMETRPAPARPNYTPRFGPAAAADPAPAQENREEEYRPYRPSEPTRPTGFGPAAQDRRPTYGSDASREQYPQQRSYDNQRSYDAQPAYTNNNYNSYGNNRGYSPRSAYNQPREQYNQPREQNYYAQDPSAPNPAVNELLAAGECGDGSGVLELHPDGYGFLRSDYFLPSSKDIYVSMAQIRRFGLRTGDKVVGKTRPQRDGDKYTAMLYITEVNGMSADELQGRPTFDELTPIYPTRRIDLESHLDKPLDDMRLIDLIAPLGFGQRGLILCPPDTGKTTLLQNFANVISTNHPEATVMVLLIDENPEDVTLFREQVSCQVIASTFDQPPENHLRLTDMVLERAQRLVEQQQDVILIVDSLTRLAKVYSTAAMQQGRNVAGMVNPTSLFRVKKLFGSARCMKEGGSLTVIGAMNIETGKVDDSVVEEFKDTANMELVLDASLAHAGVYPPINLQLSGTKRAEALLTERQQEGLQLVRSILSSIRSSAAIPQIIDLMDKTDSNDAFLDKFKAWVALMNKTR